MGTLTVSDDRLERERVFQNQRVVDGIQEEPRLKYYVALRDCDDLHNRTVRSAAVGKDILEFGCSEGEISLRLAETANTVHGIDISDGSVSTANAAAQEAGLANTTFTVADAMNTGFPDRSFDVIFGSGIIHHLDTERSMREIYRLLRAGGVAYFKEPLAGNFFLKLYRNATPGSRTPDEHPLLRHDLRQIDAIFDETEYRHFGLCSIAVVPFRRTKLELPIYRALAGIDKLIFSIPGMRWQAWYVTMMMKKSGDP